MSKIICDICGTKYPDTVEQCPICGYTNSTADNIEAEDILEEVVREAKPKTKGGRFNKANIRKAVLDESEETEETEETEVIPAAAELELADEDFDFEDDLDEDDLDDEEDEDEDDDDEDDDEDEDDDDEDDEDEDEKPGVLLNVLLGIVIVALLCVSGFIFTKYFLPNVLDSEEAIPTTEPVVQTEVVETEAPSIPCTDLMLGETVIELTEIGQYHLINVEVLPADTTDALTFTSSDETIATVNEEGRVTAVGNGMVVINITCGEYSVDCVVSVAVPEETEAPTEAVEETVEATEAPEETEAPTEPGVEKTVTNEFVNIRAGAGTGYEKVGQYKQGDVVIIYEEKMVGGRPWGRTDKGWICTEYVK